MKVFKFGGASIKDYDSIQNVAFILEKFKDEKILIVISAMGKITNALERVSEAFFEGRQEDALRLFEKIKSAHLNLLKYLLVLQWEKATNALNDFFTEVEWLLHDKPVKDYNYYYDQIVCSGELLSSTLISFFLNEKRINNQWIDVRDILRTDDTFRDAKVDWKISKRNAAEKSLPLFEKNNFVITQGFIGSTDENESTTLGREGSDFTAGIFAELLDAESVTIWKDVNGIMNADPKDFKDAISIPELSYKEVIEMAYYGAKVIHPKTIKPLQNKNIPLYVKSFFDIGLPGTVISEKQNHNLLPAVVYKRNQVLLTMQTIDFSFAEGKPTQYVNEILGDLRIKPNLSQNAAISLMICIDDIPEKTAQFAAKASEIFEVHVQRNLTLLTITHYRPQYISNLTDNKEIVLEQKTRDTIRLLIKEEDSIN